MQDISKPDNSAHRRKRRGSITGAVFSGFLAFALAFGLLYVLLAEAVGFGIILGIALVPAVIVCSTLSVMDIAAGIVAAIGEAVLVALAAIGAVFVAILGIIG
ncbi:MAG: hypothetical protein KDJ29_12420 [Hyphomicrobiales bacterium]|nr:hypothetical protein [Hyphomicrobiales bacterium]